MAILSPQEVYDLTQKKFGKYGPDVVNEMYGIAMRESGGDTNAHNLNPVTLDDSWGLWQINVRPDANPQYAGLDLTNPEVNGDVAVEMFNQSGNAPWSTRMDDIGPAGSAPNEVGTNSGSSGGAGFNSVINPGQAENLPGLVFDAGTGSYVVAATGQKATQADIRAALDRKYPDGTDGGYTPYQKDQIALQYSQLAETKRANDQQYAASIYGTNASMANSAAGLAENARQFDQSQAFAKDQWLFQKQNAIDQLALQHDQLNAELAQNARMFTLENEKLQFAKNQFAFTSAMDMRAEERATQGQMFDQQSVVANLQLNEAQITQHTKELNAQLQQEVAIFNAGKAADVSMFNIDQKTKVATFNAEAQMQTGQFNASMGFEVQKANVENERLRQQQLIDVAGKISEAAKDPGDRGALAAYILALGGGANIGATDAGLANADFRTNDSLTPLEAMLRQRSDIESSAAHPFNFTPLVAPQLAPPQQATFTPAVASQAPAPDFSGVQMPTPNTTPFDPNSIPRTANAPAPTFDATKQGFIATGATTVPGEQFNTNGAPLTAEQRAQIPDFVLQDMIARGQIPAMAQGGLIDNGRVMPMFGGAGPQAAVQKFNDVRAAHPMLAQGSQGEAHIPQGEMPQQNWLAQMYARMGGQAAGGSQQYQQNTMNGPGTQVNRQVNTNTQSMPHFGGEGQPQGQQGDMYARIAQMFPFLSFGGGGPQFNQQAFQAWLAQQAHPSNGGGQYPSQPTTQPVGSPQMPSFNWMNAPQGWDFTTPHPGYFPAAAGGGMMDGAFVAGDSPTGESDSKEIVIPIGPGQAIVMNHKQTEKMLKHGKNAKKPKKMASGGVFDQTSLGKSMYEGLLGNDTDRTRATDFLNNALGRATAGTGFNVNHLPTPVFFSSPGTSSYLTDIGAALNAMGRGIPPGYFSEQAALQRPTGYSEGAIGRTR